MFQLTPEEAKNLRFQNGISSSGYGGRRYLPHAFTEQGVATLSSVLRSRQSINPFPLWLRLRRPAGAGRPPGPPEKCPLTTV